MLEVVAKAKDEIVDVIHDFIGPSNDLDSNDVNVEDDVAMGPIISAQYLMSCSRRLK